MLAQKHRPTHINKAGRPAVCIRPCVKVQAVEGSGTAVSQAAVAPAPPIALTDRALIHLQKLKAEQASKGADSGSLLLRVGVKSGGHAVHIHAIFAPCDSQTHYKCSGMSYQMDFEDRSKVSSDDMVVPYDNGNFELVINPKSLLYLFGMQLDYSDALIGGGFQFQNPNAKDSCGCGKSFGV